MKKSILTKILLAMLMVALIFSVAACGKKKEPNTPVTPPTTTKDPALAEQIVGVMKGADPLLKTLHGITADKTVGVELGLNVKFAAGKDKNEKDVKGDYSLNIDGRLNKTAPEFDINYKSGSTEWVKLAYKDKKVYLGQPLTAVNTAAEVDKVSVDVAALEPSVKDLMDIAMDAIAGVAKDIPDGIPSDMVDFIDEFLQGDLASGILNVVKLEVQKIDKGNRIELTDESFNSILPVLSFALPTNIMDIINGTVVPFLKSVNNEDKIPTVRIDVLQSNNVINCIKLGYYYGSQDYYGELSIDIAASTEDSNVGKVSAPSDYTAKALEANVNGKLPQKGINADLKVDVNPNFSAANMGFASLDFTDNNDKLLAAVKGYANNGKSVFFDTAAVYTALGMEVPANTTYKASLASDKSVADLINENVKKVRDDYFANKDKKPSGDGDKKEEPKEPSKGILVNIYEWLGGKAKDLGTNGEGDKIAYNNPSEKQMLAQLNAKIGKYCTFKVDEDSYFKVVKSIVKLVAENDTWITGIDIVDADKVESAAEWGDLLKAIKEDIKATENNVYGIVNWDTTTWKGGIQLYKDGEQNDLLDAVNVFARKCKEGEQPSLITLKDITDELDYYVAALGYWLPGVYDATQMAAIDEADKALFKAKNAYYKYLHEHEEKDTEANLKAYEDAKKANKDALKAIYTSEKTQTVLKMVFGIDSTLNALLSGGANLYVGSVKDGGLNGFIGLKKEAASANTDTYFELGLGLGFVENKVIEDAGKVGFKIDGAIDITKIEDEKVKRMNDRFKIYLDKDGFIVTDPEKAEMVDHYLNGENLLDELSKMMEEYCKHGSFTVEAAE